MMATIDGGDDGDMRAMIDDGDEKSASVARRGDMIVRMVVVMVLVWYVTMMVTMIACQLNLFRFKPSPNV